MESGPTDSISPDPPIVMVPESAAEPVILVEPEFVAAAELVAEAELVPGLFDQHNLGSDHQLDGASEVSACDTIADTPQQDPVFLEPAAESPPALAHEPLGKAQAEPTKADVPPTVLDADIYNEGDSTPYAHIGNQAGEPAKLQQSEELIHLQNSSPDELSGHTDSLLSVQGD